MPPSHDVHSDYPLIFTSFGYLDIGAFKHRPRAIVSPADPVQDSTINPHCFRPARRTHLPAQVCRLNAIHFAESFARTIGREQIVLAATALLNLWGRVERQGAHHVSKQRISKF